MKTTSLLCFLLLFGCSYVASKYPIGIENYVVSPDEWNGTWLNDDEVIKIHVTDESKGILKLAWIEQDKEEFKLETITCQIKKGKKWLYFNTLEIPGEKPNGYYFWGRIKKENRRILFWLPSVENFKRVSDSKKIHAIVEKASNPESGKQYIQSIKLIEKPEVIIDLVENDGCKYFEWDDPLVLIKIDN